MRRTCIADPVVAFNPINCLVVVVVIVVVGTLSHCVVDHSS